MIYRYYSADVRPVVRMQLRDQPPGLVTESNGQVTAVQATTGQTFAGAAGAITRQLQGNVPYLSFGPGASLLSSLDMPATLCGNHPRSIYMVVRTSGHTRNILGWGDTSANKRLCDVLEQSQYVGLHVAGNDPRADNVAEPLTAAVWHVVSFLLDGSNCTVSVDASSRTYEQTLDTAVSPLRLGGGSFTGLNANGTVDLAHVEILDSRLTPSDDQRTIYQLQNLYKDLWPVP